MCNDRQQANVSLHFVFLFCFFFSGLYQDASREYTKVLEINPNHSGASYNLGNLYRDIGREDKAQQLLQNTMLLNYQGWDVVGLLSLFDLSTVKSHDSDQFWHALAIALNVTIDGGRTSLRSEIERVQRHYLDSANALIKFQTNLKQDPFIQHTYRVYSLLRRTLAEMEQRNTTASPLPPILTTTATTTTTTNNNNNNNNNNIAGTEFHIIAQYYHAATPDRQIEIEECLRRNLALPNVVHVHVLTEEYIFFDPQRFQVGYSKIKQTVVGQRLTFAAAFHYANQHLQGHVVTVANADIYFEQHSISNVISKIQPRTVYATLRWEHNSMLKPRIDSQDSWIFQAPVHVKNVTFEIGRLRSDNRIAAELEHSNYRVVNNPFVVRTFHIQSEQKRPNRTNQEQIPGRTTHVLLQMGM